MKTRTKKATTTVSTTAAALPTSIMPVGIIGQPSTLTAAITGGNAQEMPNGIIERVKQAHQSVFNCYMQAIDHAHQCGKALNEALLFQPPQHGEREQWYQEKFGFSERTAQQYRQIASVSIETLKGAGAKTITGALQAVRALNPKKVKVVDAKVVATTPTPTASEPTPTNPEPAPNTDIITDQPPAQPTIGQPPIEQTIKSMIFDLSDIDPTGNGIDNGDLLSWLYDLRKATTTLIRELEDLEQQPAALEAQQAA
jgi:hypothetical protein